MRHYARSLDLSHKGIVDALEGAGCGVGDLSSTGGGIPDLVVCGPVWPFETVLMELKTPKADRCGVKWSYTKAQLKFRARWKGRIITAETPEEALNAMGILG